MIRTCIALTAAAALLVVAAPAQASNVQLVSVVIKWSAVIGKDADALGPAADKGPAQADAAALKLKRDSHAAANAADAVKPSSAVGFQVRDQFSLALRDFEQSGLELHLAVVADGHNDAKGANAHANKAMALANAGSKLLTQTAKLLAKLKP
jgi:hypothetical protein